MPTYPFRNMDTGEEYELFMGMTAREEYLRDNPRVEQLVCSPAIVSGRGMKKPDNGFRDLLRTIKKGNSKGFYRSTVNTF